ncbi:MAG TPA: hypothetical protein VGV61_01890 [Thermoanaerobaculia bacterium]|nr:hypothetical protein [Thermoanaerobaculia bacterium]
MPRTLSLLALIALLAPGAAQAAGTNGLQNPDFDADLSHWSFDVTTGTGTFAGPGQAQDANGCPNSGSVSIAGVSVGASFVAAVIQCVPNPGGLLTAKFRAKVVSGTNVRGNFLFNDCSTLLSHGGGSDVPLASTGWTDVVHEGFTGGGSTSEQVSFVAVSSSGPFTVLIDRAFVGRFKELFADGFEIGSTCRWNP